MTEPPKPPRPNTRPMAAEADEDPNAEVVCSSPPCFLHELDPAWLGYLSRAETLALLDAVLAGAWTAPETEGLRPRLQRHRAALGAMTGTACGAAAEPPPQGPARLRATLREALPKLYDEGLRRDLEALLHALDAASPQTQAEGG